MNERPWLTKVKETYRLHKECISKMNGKKWKVSDTAKMQKRSLGMVCEDLLIAQWMKTHSVQIQEFEYRSEALEYIRSRKHHLLTEGDID